MFGSNFLPWHQALSVGFDGFLLVILLACFVFQATTKGETPFRVQRVQRVQLVCIIYNSLLGFACFCFGAMMLENLHRNTKAVTPLSAWAPPLEHGLVWMLITFAICSRRSLRPLFLTKTILVLAILYSATCLSFSVVTLVKENTIPTSIVFEVLSLPGAFLFFACVKQQLKLQETDNKQLYTPLKEEDEDEDEDEIAAHVTPFSNAGIYSVVSFGWLNPLMKNGAKKPLNNEDIPKLRHQERAETCYDEFMEHFNDKKGDPNDYMRALFHCHKRELVVSGFYALMKIITLAAGPLLLNVFVSIAEGKRSLRYEGYMVAGFFFLCKVIESVSQRQWFFRSRLIGLKIRSLLMAMVYKKQMGLCSAARSGHSSSQIMNYVTVDAYRVGEFPLWVHQSWTTGLQLCLSLFIVFNAVGVATFAALITIVLMLMINAPLAKLQNKFQQRLMAAQDERLKGCTEALTYMKVLKLYAWETNFKEEIERLRTAEVKHLSAMQSRKAASGLLLWSTPVLVSVSTFTTCYFLKIPLNASNVFTFVATLRLVQEPIRMIPDVIVAAIQAKVSFSRIVGFLNTTPFSRDGAGSESGVAIRIKSGSFKWEKEAAKATLRDVNLEVRFGEKIAVCGEVGSGKSSLLDAVLGELPNEQGTVEVNGTIAYVSQTAWIQTGTIRDNILFGSAMDERRYNHTVKSCALTKDFVLFPYGDQTEIGEKGVNLSGGQKQRIQLARALYRDADIYLLDDPFSAVDAETATTLFNEYVMGALANKTVLLVTHQVDFLPAFDSVLLMIDGEIRHAAPYNEVLSSSREFQLLVEAHKETAGSQRLAHVAFTKPQSSSSSSEISKVAFEKSLGRDNLIKKEEREIGDNGFKAYMQYLGQNNGYLYFSVVVFGQTAFIVGQIMQNAWMARSLDDTNVTDLKLIAVYFLLGLVSMLFLASRSIATVVLGIETSKSLFSQLLKSLIRAPMAFYDSTPIGRILSRFSYDLSIVDLEIPFGLTFAVAPTLATCSVLVTLGVVTWQILLVCIPLLFVVVRLQKYYISTAKELMRINGTTKSSVANHLAESVAGSVTIRAFNDEKRFLSKAFELIDGNAATAFHSFSANEWLIERLEFVGASVLASTALFMVLLPPQSFSSGLIGLSLSYALSLNVILVLAIQNQCNIANHIISVERVNQYMNIPSEADLIVEKNRPSATWPDVGNIDICKLQIRYRPDGPLVLKGITCRFEGRDKIGIVGRTGCGKSTLIGALFRLVEPCGGKILVDGIDITEIGLQDLRSRFGIIPQDPTLFKGTVRFNLDPLSRHSDHEIWEVLGKCRLRDVIEEKKAGLDSTVEEDGSNWSMGQRQLFCLGRALLRKSKILVLDEATASIDNATDLILQRIIRAEFAECTVITVAHRIPTVMDCTKVLAISEGQLVEFEEPMELMKRENSLFGQLVKEYWSHFAQ